MKYKKRVFPSKNTNNLIFIFLFVDRKTTLECLENMIMKHNQKYVSMPICIMMVVPMQEYES